MSLLKNLWKHSPLCIRQAIVTVLSTPRRRNVNLFMYLVLLQAVLAWLRGRDYTQKLDARKASISFVLILHGKCVWTLTFHKGFPMLSPLKIVISFQILALLLFMQIHHNFRLYYFVSEKIF